MESGDSKKKDSGESGEKKLEAGPSKPKAEEANADVNGQSELLKNSYAEDERNVRQLLHDLQLHSKGNKQAEKKFEFWSTQPVPQFGQSVNEGVNQPIEPDKTEVRPDPFSVPEGFFWDTLDIMKDETLAEVYELLRDHYVEDDDSMFRFNYPKNFLKWALTPPGWISYWHVGLRANKSKKLLGFISGVPALIAIKGAKTAEEAASSSVKKMSEINFLCVHKKLRSKRVAVVLIKEITRRCNEKGVFQAVYTAGALLPRPLVTSRYHHRNINCGKLVDIKFAYMSGNMTRKRMNRLYKLPEQTAIPGLRKLELKDMKEVTVLLNNYLSKFQLYPVYSEEELTHWLNVGQEYEVMTAYVVADPQTSKITDLISFYHLPSTVVNHDQYDSLHAVYSFFNVAGSVSWEKLMTDALVLAEKKGTDVFNALDIMDNSTFLEKLKFGPGDGKLNYYVYNWICPEIQPNENGLVLM